MLYIKGMDQAKTIEFFNVAFRYLSYITTLKRNGKHAVESNVTWLITNLKLSLKKMPLFSLLLNIHKY